MNLDDYRIWKCNGCGFNETCLQITDDDDISASSHSIESYKPNNLESCGCPDQNWSLTTLTLVESDYCLNLERAFKRKQAEANKFCEANQALIADKIKRIEFLEEIASGDFRPVEWVETTTGG